MTGSIDNSDITPDPFGWVRNKCPNGHGIPAGASTCEQCGATWNKGAEARLTDQDQPVVGDRAAVNMKCIACGEPASEVAQYCGLCGAKLPGQQRCFACGTPLLLGANFCPSCGNEVNESNDEEDYVSEAVAALADLACPNGLIILYDGREKHRMRIEVTVRPDGAIPSDQYGVLVESLQDISIREGYLVVDVRIDGNIGTCVWHIIGGGIFGLVADHGVSVLLYYDSIWPGFSETDWSKMIDAPSLEGR